MEKDKPTKKDIPSLLLQGVLLGRQRMLEQAKKDDRTLVIMRDGKIVHVRAREL